MSAVTLAPASVSRFPRRGCNRTDSREVERQLLLRYHAEGNLAAREELVERFLPLAREDFWCFVELTFKVLHPGQPLIYAEYLEVMATLLMSAAERRKRWSHTKVIDTRERER